MRKAGSQQGRVYCETANPDFQEPSVPSLACMSRVDDLAAGKAIRCMLNLFGLTLEDVVVGQRRATQWSSDLGTYGLGPEAVTFKHTTWVASY